MDRDNLQGEEEGKGDQVDGDGLEGMGGQVGGDVLEGKGVQVDGDSLKGKGGQVGGGLEGMGKGGLVGGGLEGKEGQADGDDLELAGEEQGEVDLAVVGDQGDIQYRLVEWEMTVYR